MSRFVVEVREWKGLDVSPDEVLGLTEAARRLGLSGANSVASLIKHGDLRYVRDTSEPNPQKQGRVLVKDVEREIERRRTEKGRADGRLKRRRSATPE